LLYIGKHLNVVIGDISGRMWNNSTYRDYGLDNKLFHARIIALIISYIMFFNVSVETMV